MQRRNKERIAAGSTEVAAIQASPSPRRNGLEPITTLGIDIAEQARLADSMASPHDRSGVSRDRNRLER
jgi:hypothetical protein